MGHEVTVCPDGLTAVAALETQHLRLHPRRPRHAGPDGIEVIAKCQGAVARDRGGRAHRQALARNGDRRAAARRVRLPHQALQAGRARSAAQPRRREARADATSTARCKRQLERLEGTPQLIGDTPGDAAGAQADRQGRADRLDRADPRRDRHRQGAGRPRRCTTRACGPRCRSSRSTAARCPRT